MQTIWKYEISPDWEQQEIEMPIGATILSFGIDGTNSLCLWAIVNPEAPKMARVVGCYGTGWPLDFTTRGARFVGTVTHGAYVWHLFDYGEKI